MEEVRKDGDIHDYTTQKNSHTKKTQALMHLSDILKRATTKRTNELQEEVEDDTATEDHEKAIDYKKLI